MAAIKEDRKTPDWAELLNRALTEPGLISAAYRQFHRYSVSNAMIITLEAMIRGLELGPVASFKAWKEKGYIVKKGQKALPMLMPVMIGSSKKTAAEGSTEIPVEVSDKSSPEKKRRIFILRNNWFLFCQVEPEEDAEPLTAPEVLEWDMSTAIRTLGIPLLPFDKVDGNIQGYACESGIAINPMARYPMKTATHEMAHVLLGHIGETRLVDGETLTRSKAEAEAESVAFIVMSALDMDEAMLSSSRAYIQNWLGGDTGCPERESFIKKSASRIFSIADKILRAGRPAAEDPVAVCDVDAA